MNRTKYCVLLASCLLPMIFPFAASGQTSTAITGLVADKTGAVVPKAVVTAQNEATNQKLTTVTTATGSFTFTTLRPGVYAVSVTAPGFDTAIETGVELHLDAVVTVKLTLKPGATTETVTVHADQVQLDVTHASRGEVFTQDELEQSPFNSGNPLMLANSEPGTLFKGTDDAFNQWVRPFDAGSINQFSVNGGVSDSNDFQIDGSPNNTITFGARNIGYMAPIASVQEMKVIINPYDSQYGHTGGGIFDMVTKYGGNQIHGQVYEDARRTWLDANSHFNDANKGTKQSDTRDEYGIELDGPVVIPHFYNGRDKTFFAVQLQRYMEKQPQSGIDSVPEFSPGSTTQAAWQTGDFSGATYWAGTAGNQPLTIYNPFSAPAAGGQVQRTAFAKNYISPAMMNQTAKDVLGYLPLPNRQTPLGVPWGQQNYFWQQEADFPYDNVVGRLDRNFGARDRTFARFAWSKNWQLNADYHGIPGPAATGVFPLIFQNHLFTTDWQHTFTPNSLFDVHLTFARFAYPQRQGPTPFDLSNIGLGALSRPGIQPVFPEFNIGGVSLFGNWADNGGNKLTISNTVSAMPMWTYVHGAHSMKAGLDYRLLRSSTYTPNASSGTFATNCFWTQQPNFGGCPIGQGLGLASFLLGVMDSGRIDITPKQYFTYPYYAPFFQDDWKLTQRLTINLGVRWDFQGPPSESANKVLGNFDTASANPVQGQVNSSLMPANTVLLGGLTFAGVNGQPRTLFRRDNLLIQPRFGFNFAVDTNTVFRGGIGTTYVQFAGQGYSNGFSQSTSYVSSTNAGQTVNGNLLDNPFPVIAQPNGSSLGLMSSLGSNISTVNPNYQIPGVLNYSLGLERQIGRHSSVDLSYVGTHGLSMDTSDNLNHVSAQWQAQCNQEMGATPTQYALCLNSSSNNPEWVPNPFLGVPGFATAQTGNPLGYYTNSRLAASVFTRPYPEFGSINQTQQNNGYSEFDSLQVVATHHWTNALTLHGNFVWSKQMDGGGWSDTVYRIKQHFLDGGSPAWRVATNVDWHLPVGRGRTFLKNTNRLVDSVVGNWVMGGIYTYQAGLPAPLARGGGGLEIIKTQHYDRKRLINLNGDQVIRGMSSCVGWYDPNPPAPRQKYTLGDVPGQDYSKCQVNPAGGHMYDFINRPSFAAVQSYSDSGVRLPRGQSFDMSMSKSFPVWREAKLQMRFEGYNVLNHPSWAGVDYWTQNIDPNFGTINMKYDNQSNAPRQVQLSGKIIW